jgi:hypothetical protein
VRFFKVNIAACNPKRDDTPRALGVKISTPNCLLVKIAIRA